jgi:metallo-beta-lactamase family protein
VSAHADRDQLLAWLKAAAHLPERIFVTHGEPAGADALRQHLRRDFATDVTVPEQGETMKR